MKRKFLFLLLTLIVLSYLYYWQKVGTKIDHMDGVAVYYNGWVSNVAERNVAADGYNLGLKWQCVEFVKRFYYEKFQHKMSNSYGHAKDFYNNQLNDGDWNTDRGLHQFTNPSSTPPQKYDLLVYGGYAGNKYGHVAIISKVAQDHIEIIQQNAGIFGPSRKKIPLVRENGRWKLDNEQILGWLSR